MFEASTATGAAGRCGATIQGNAELGPSGSAGVKVIQARPLRRLDVLVQERVGVAVLVPGDAGLGVVAVGRDLHRGPRAVLVKPAEAADRLLFRFRTARDSTVGLDRVDPKLGLLAGLDPLGPGVAEQAVGQQAEVMRRVGPMQSRRCTLLAPKPGF